MSYAYLTNQESPPMQFDWCGNEGPIDFSAGWTFSVKLTSLNSNTTVLTKSSNIVGRALMPNVVVFWSAGELAALTPGKYRVYLTATSGSNDRVFNPLNPPVITILASPT